MQPRHIISLLAAFSIINGCSNSPDIANAQVEPKDKAHKATEITRVEHLIFFEFESHELPHNNELILSPHANYLISNPQEIVLVEGFADEVGEENFNQQLGLKRADAVAQKLLQMGVSARQLIIRSAGELKPLNWQHSEMSRARNRRVALFY